METSTETLNEKLLKDLIEKTDDRMFQDLENKVSISERA